MMRLLVHLMQLMIEGQAASLVAHLMLLVVGPNEAPLAHDSGLDGCFVAAIHEIRHGGALLQPNVRLQLLRHMR